MAKTVRDTRLETRTARGKLAPSGKPYFKALDPNLHIGYRKGKHGGKWVMRRYVGDERYVVETIGDADDIADADGVQTLTFHQAQDKSRERVAAIAEEARIAALGPAVTVRGAIEEYVASREAREASQHADQIGLKRDSRSRLVKHVPEHLAAKPLATLSTDDLTAWRASLKMAAGSVQRTVNDFKAALNAAAKSYKKTLPADFRDTVRGGLATVDAAGAVAREAQALPDADIRAIVAAAWEVDAAGEWEGDLARLVIALAATGARFSQIIRMRVADVQAQQHRLVVPTSRKGRGKKAKSDTPIRVGDDVLAALAKAVAGRKGGEPLFLRPRWQQVAAARWIKGERGPWHSSSELNRPWALIRERAGLPVGTVAYCLRHSSIVRGLGAGLPVNLVASLHDTSAAMIEAHYGAYIVSALEELAARAVVPLTTAPAIVIPIERGARA